MGDVLWEAGLMVGCLGTVALGAAVVVGVFVFLYLWLAALTGTLWAPVAFWVLLLIYFLTRR